ncbi:fam-c protein [Plasmodium vinckei lentum]|uniref:Fam-c protein n=1 Tax=Plasmodium vinckei lentum TaxID=138297 RepID=A0A6V7SU12_PLAVN|nr:fam-c protein [Plasmodium vinckei lentum]
MNRRIFSLVCIALYALLDASIYCSQQKESAARNKSVRDGTKDNLYSEAPSNLPYNEMVKAYMIINKYYCIDRWEFEEYVENIFRNSPKQSEILKKLFDEILKDPTNYKPRAKLLKYYYKTNPIKKQNQRSNEIEEETKSKKKRTK